jgi:pyruvate dehydrogenase E2 component (dihydrolipoamide acetyltransferase)
VTASGSGKGEVRIEEPTRVQRTIARRTAESRATVPDLELSVEVDMTECLTLPEAQSCSPTAIVLRACALALRDVPRANGAYRDGRFEVYGRVNVGLVVATEDALAIPVVFDADQKPLQQLSEETQRLTDRAYRGELTPPELSGSTCTLTDVGPHGIASASPVIVPPHAAAVAAGAVRATAQIRDDGALVAGHAMTVTLAADHRILYGQHAFRFLAAIRSHLEDVRL